MTEEEWAALPDWHELEMFEIIRGKVSDRKMRLFAVACCKSVCSLLSEQGSEAVEIAERYADQMATEDELLFVREQFRATETDPVVEILDGERYRVDAGGSTADRSAIRAAINAMFQSAHDAMRSALRSVNRRVTPHEIGSILLAERNTRRRLLQEVLGPLPFRPVALDSRWLTSVVVDLAAAIYNERAFDRMPILADALLDAGCVSDEIIAHCRGEEPHVRGCWVVDMLLGKT